MFGAGGRTKKRRGWPDTDATLTVLQAQDSGDRVIATLVNFAAHPTVLRQDNLLFSRDFPGALVHGLERLLGGGGNVHAVHQVESTLIASKLLGLKRDTAHERSRQLLRTGPVPGGYLTDIALAMLSDRLAGLV